MNIIKKLVTTFKDGENNALIISQKRNGESTSDHKKRVEKRIEVMKKIMVERPDKKKIKSLLENLEKSNKSDQKKLKTLLDEIITSINKWKYECKRQGENPVCISHFASFGPETTELSPTCRYAIFGEQEVVMGLLTLTNEMLDPKGGKYSLFKKN